MLQSEKFLKEYRTLKSQCEGKFILGGIDRNSILSGITEKLVGYRHFVEKWPEDKDKVRLIQYTFDLMMKEAQEEASELECTLSHDPKTAERKADCVMLVGKITKEQRWALMAVSNTWIVTSLRFGYNLVCRTYTRV